MPTGKLYQLTLTGAIAGQFCQNILHFQFEELSSETPFINAVAIANGWVGQNLVHWLSVLPSSYEMSSVRCRQISDGGGATYTQTSGVGGEVGARSDAISVTTVGPLLCFPATVDDAVVGKIFLPGVAEDDIEYNILGSSILTDITTFLSDFLDPVAISGTVVGNLNYCVANAAKDNWAKPDGGYASATIGTQRRRAKPTF